MRRDPAILFLAVGQTLIWASIYYVFPALLLRWEQELAWSKADLTAAITLAVLVSALASPLAGRFIDKGQGAALMGTSALLGGLGLLLLSLVSQTWHFYVVWTLIGLSMAGCLYEPCFAIVTRTRGAEAKRAIIFITLAAGFASTISFPTVYALAESHGWRNALRILAAAVIFIVVPLLYVGAKRLEVTHVERTRSSPIAGQSRAFLQRPAFWFLAIGFAFLAMAHGASLHHLLPILDERGLSSDMAVLAASFIGPMQVAGRLAMMASERHLSNHGVAITAFIALTASIALLLVSTSTPAFLVGFVILFGGAYGTVSILRPLLAREILGETNFGAKSGALAVPYLAGSAFAPYVGALIWNVGGYDLMLITLLGIMVLGLLFYANAQRLRSRE